MWQRFAKVVFGENREKLHELSCGHTKPPHESKYGVPYSRQWCPVCTTPAEVKKKPERVWITRTTAEAALKAVQCVRQGRPPGRITLGDQWLHDADTAIAGLRAALERKDQGT